MTKTPQDPAAAPLCDLVLQGGFASGVVYPRAIARIAQDYRFHSVGGASAGAIGAAFAAAAELGRDGGGFTRLEGLVPELGGRLSELVVPEPSTRVLFDTLIGVMKAARSAGGTSTRLWRIVGVVVASYRRRVLLGAAVGLLLVLAGVLSIVLGTLPGSAIGAPVAILGGVVIGAVLAAVLIMIRVVHTVRTDLVANDFGLVRGMGTPQAQGFTAWIDEKLCELAGRPARPGSVTFGDLHDAGIDLRTITTDLSQRRLHDLPEAIGEFWFDEGEWRRLFDGAVIERLLDASPDRRGSLHRMPAAREVPVIVAVRLSLSYSGVISAVPLYIEVGGVLVRDWFSDGGIVSNFPVDLFDSPSPRWPTFAIMLAGVPEDYDGPMWDVGAVPDAPRPPIRSDITDVAGFAGAVLGAAMSWYDESYVPLPGFRDRIARVMLRPTEGGLNLEMPATVVDELAQRGRDAADALVRRFRDPVAPGSTATGWDHHIWIRHRAFVATLPVLLDGWTRGHAVLDTIPVAAPPTLPLGPEGQALLETIRAHLDALATSVHRVAAETRAQLVEGIEPPTELRRTPIT